MDRNNKLCKSAPGVYPIPDADFVVLLYLLLCPVIALVTEGVKVGETRA